MGNRSTPDLAESFGAVSDERFTEGSRHDALPERVYHHGLVLGVQLYHLCPKTIEELLQGFSLILSYVEKIVRNGWGSPICNVLLSEQLKKLHKRRHVAIKEADEPIHRCAYQHAHEQLASHHVRAPNQHHLRMEGREMSLWVLYTCECGFGPHECGRYHGVHDRLREWHWEMLGGVVGS